MVFSRVFFLVIGVRCGVRVVQIRVRVRFRDRLGLGLG